MKLVVMRHGHKDKKTGLLTEQGRIAARHAGDWLKEKGIVPGHAVVTTEDRTRETACEVLGRCAPEGDVPIRDREGVPAALPAFITFANEQRALAGEDGAVLVVCHHPSQGLIERHLGGARVAAHKDNRAALFVLEPHGDGWRCVDGWPGE